MLRASSRLRFSARPEASATAKSTDNVREVMDALRRIVRDLRLSARDAERRAGVSGAQLFVLQTLSEANASSLNDLAERTSTDQSSVSVVVRRLCERKLVARKASEDDGRRVELSLTASGRKLLARCPEPTQVRLVGGLRRMRAAELASLTVGLRGLVQQMGIEDAATRMLFDEEAPTKPKRRAPSRKASGK